MTGYAIEKAQVTALEAPPAAPKGQKVDVTLRMYFPTPGWSYNATDVVIDEPNRTVTFRPTMKRPKYMYLPGAAQAGESQVIEAATAVASFTPMSAGVYHLKTEPEAPEGKSIADITITE